MKNKILKSLLILACAYILICGLFYFFQDNLIFVTDKLDKNYKFHFNQRFEEFNIKTNDNITLNGLLFKTDCPKGLILYLHGNAGSLRTWGEIAKTYTDLNYDLFMLDYRGYGKSDGKIKSQDQLFSDIQTVYEKLKERYEEDKIIVLGYSLGTGLAAKLASSNKPKLLILQAPYYSLPDLMCHRFLIVPTFMLKYNIETNKYIQGCKIPIVIFHGDNDHVIYFNSSLKLKKFLKPNDRLIILAGQGHSGMSDNQEYLLALKQFLHE